LGQILTKGLAPSVLQENHYYPLGMEMEGAWTAQVGTENAYQYNGKELNEDFGLNLSDYGARWYDAAVGRWWSVDPLGQKFANSSLYCYVLNNPLLLIDPNGMESEAYSGGLSGLAKEEREISRREQEEARKEATQQESSNKSSVSLTVTDEVVGTGYVYADGQVGTGYYFDVNIYKMAATYTGKDGSTINQDFEVLKYGVKYNKSKKSYYYQSFGRFSELTEDIKITNLTYDSKYTYGGFNLFQGGLYDLHPQHSAIRNIPNNTGGRVNKGCIGVCGSGVDGWGGLTDILFTAANMTAYVGEPQRKKKGYLGKMLSKIELIVIIQPFSIPNGTPVPIKK
jgi:RHS repeat-associated protein